MRKPYIMDGTLPAVGAMDFSYLLDAPAGKHGFVQVKDGHLYFEDGLRAKFFGCDIAMNGCMPDKEKAEVDAERIAKSGLNIVRLHLADVPNIGNDISIIDYDKRNSRSLHKENLDKYDYLVYQLKQRGIYIHMDLFVGRNFLPGDDLEFPDDLETGDTLKQINLFNPRLIELQKEFATQLLTHVNPYTGLAYKDDPAIAVVQLCNENSMFQSISWNPNEEMSSSYARQLKQMWNQWLLDKYGSRRALDEAWTNEYGVHALGEDEDPEKGTVIRLRDGSWRQNHFEWYQDYDAVTSPARFADTTLFLIDVSRDFVNAMYTHLREIGLRCPINYSNHFEGAADAYTNTFSDVNEGNCYWNHPQDNFEAPVTFSMKEMHSCDPRKHFSSCFTTHPLTHLCINCSHDKPFIVTEWNSIYPTLFSSDDMINMAVYGSLQDWDGLIFHAYDHANKLDQMHNEYISALFESHNDPSIFGQAAIASAIFLGGLVQAGKNTIEVAYTPTDLTQLPYNWQLPYANAPFFSKVRNRYLEDDTYQGDADAVLSSGFTATGDYTQANHSIVFSRNPYGDPFQKKRTRREFIAKHMQDGEDLKVFENDYLHHYVGKLGKTCLAVEDEHTFDQSSEAFSHVLDQAMKGWGLWSHDVGLQEGDKLVSDTGEIIFDWLHGVLKVSAPQVKAVAGDIHEAENWGRFTLNMTNRKMTATLFAKDGKDTENSEHLLLMAVGESGNTGMKWDPTVRNLCREGNVLVDMGGAPVWVDQLDGELKIAGGKDATVYYLGPQGQRVAEAEKTVCGEDAVFSLNPPTESASIYYEIVM